MIIDFMNLDMQRVSTIKAQDETQALQLFLTSKNNKYKDLIMQSDNMCIQIIKDGKMIIKFKDEDQNEYYKNLIENKFSK